MNEKRSQFFGRKLGKPLTKSRQAALDCLLPALEIPVEDGVPIDVNTLFADSAKPLWLEIGFGNGEHCTGLLDQHPDINLIAIEPFINGMAAFLKDLQNRALSSHGLTGGSILPMDYPVKPGHDNILKRVRVFMEDALLLVGALPATCIDRLYILNPDPWHKKRHHKRRIVRPETLDEYARILKPGANLIMSTDVPDLAEWMITHTFNHPAFEWTANSACDWREKPANWIDTRYQTKGAKGADKMVYFHFRRK